MIEVAGSIFRIQRNDISGKARRRRIRGLEAKLMDPGKPGSRAGPGETGVTKKRKMAPDREREDEP
jgi:hypothetical protein